MVSNFLSFHLLPSLDRIVDRFDRDVQASGGIGQEGGLVMKRAAPTDSKKFELSLSSERFKRTAPGPIRTGQDAPTRAGPWPRG